jgi:hypothetical protein
MRHDARPGSFLPSTVHPPAAPDCILYFLRGMDPCIPPGSGSMAKYGTLKPEIPGSLSFGLIER